MFDDVIITIGYYYVKGNLRTTGSNQTIEGKGTIIKGASHSKFDWILTVGQQNYTDGITTEVIKLNISRNQGETLVATEWGHGIVVINTDSVIINNITSVS